MLPLPRTAPRIRGMSSTTREFVLSLWTLSWGQRAMCCSTSEEGEGERGEGERMKVDQ